MSLLADYGKLNRELREALTPDTHKPSSKPKTLPEPDKDDKDGSER
jgi:hypothetical protein